MPATQLGPIVVDASALTADLPTVNLLARLHLDARRLGSRVLLREVPDDLERLIAFAGLAEVLCVEPRRQPEQREQPLGSEKERQLPDPPV